MNAGGKIIFSIGAIKHRRNAPAMVSENEIAYCDYRHINQQNMDFFI